MDWPPTLPFNSPLTLHPRGYQARIAGKVRWVAGKVPYADAIKAYHRKAAALVSGRPAPPPEPKAIPDGAIVTLHYVLNRWLLDRRADAQRGELRPGTFMQYKRSAKRLDDAAGHVPVDDFSPDKTRWVYDQVAAAHTVDVAKRSVAHLRDACRHAEEQGWCKPVRLGEKVVKKLVSRQAPVMKWRLYTPAEVRAILAEVDRRIARGHHGVPTWRQMRAMILLALNGGFGSAELSELTKGQVDAAGGRLKHQRGKTGAEHFVPLWPETVEALAHVLAMRPGDDLLFRTREGNPWCRVTAKDERISNTGGNDNVKWQFNQVTKAVGLRIKGQSFYKLKHLAGTTADAMTPPDPHATYAVYGHKLPGSKGHYVDVGDERQRRVVEHVRHVLLLSPLPEGPHPPTPGPGGPPPPRGPGRRPRRRAAPGGASEGG